MKTRADIGLWALRVGAWLVSAFAGYSFLLNPVVPGITFGLAVVVWRWADTGRLPGMRSVVFVGASTINFAIVIGIARVDMMNAPVFDPVEPAVIVGTVLLPVAQHYVFGLEWRRIIVAVPTIYFAAYVTALIASALVPNAPWNTIVNPVAAWQLAYLLTMRPDEIRTT